MKRNHHINVMILCLLSIFFIRGLNLHAQTFKAQIENVGGYYRLTFTVTSSQANNFTPPSLANFEVLSGPSTSTFSNYQLINGHASHSESTSYTYILSPRKNGRLTIGPATIHVGGKVLHSNAVTFNAQSSNGNNANHSQTNSQTSSVQQAGSAVTNKDLFIDVTPNRTKIREQEAVLLTYRVHARVGVGLSNTSLIQKPDFKGLISQEIPLPGNQIQTTIENRGGRTYRTGTILQYVVFPQKSGTITIPSITFDCAVVQQDNTMDLADAFFNGGGTISLQVRRTVAPITLNVEPLPQPRPANFSGAVGQFNIQAQLLNKKVRTNDVATYRITLNGLGNLKLITAPSVKFPNDFDTYDAKTTDQTQTTANGLHGQLVFDYTFVPRNIGEYTIPATDFVYFDTESGTYKTLHTAPIKLQVEKGERSNADVDKQLALLKSDIRPLHDTTQTAKLFAWGSWSYRLLYIIIIICYIVIAQLSNRLNLVKSSASYKQRNAFKNAIKQIQAANNKHDRYTIILKSINEYLSVTFNLEISDLTTEKVTEVLTENKIPITDINEMTRIIEKCQFAQYAPVGMNDGQELQQQAIANIEAIQNNIH